MPPGEPHLLVMSHAQPLPTDGGPGPGPNERGRDGRRLERPGTGPFRAAAAPMTGPTAIRNSDLSANRNRDEGDSADADSFDDLRRDYVRYPHADTMPRDGHCDSGFRVISPISSASAASMTPLATSRLDNSANVNV